MKKKSITKEEAFALLAEHGITALAVSNPEVKKEWVLEFLEKLDQTPEFKEYYRDFIAVNFA
jgi:hypothetical protein